MALDPITAIIGLVDDVVSGVTASQKADLALKLQSLNIAAQQDTEQAAVDAAEGTSSSLFVAGARPMIMWGLGIIVVLYAFLTLGLNFATALHYSVIPMPPLDPMVRDIVLGLLGLGHITRTFEKWKGVQGNH